MKIKRWLAGWGHLVTYGWLLLMLCSLGLPLAIHAAVPDTPDTPESSPAPVRVGIRDTRPFIFLDEQGEPRGYTIDLWKAIADKLGISYRFVPLQGIAATLQAMQQDQLDIAIGAITITQEREKKFDFSYSHYHTGLGIVTPINPGYSFDALFSSFFTKKRLQRLGTFLLFLVISAHVIWLVERRHQHTFNRKYLPGVFEGIYWSVVTASTVGYGDYTPRSKTGRALAVLVIIISLPLFGVFIANISSDITLHELRNVVTGPQDLVGKRVGVVSGSSSESFLARIGLPPGFTAPKAEQLYKLLEDGTLDAVVQDLPSLQYYVANSGRGKVEIVGAMFDKQDYAFLLPDASPHKEMLDQVMLQLVEDGTEAVIRHKWFGAEQRTSTN